MAVYRGLGLCCAVHDSRAEQYVQRKGWSYRIANDQINVEVCPFCANSNYELYIARGGNKDGLWQCVVCNSSGNLRSLMEALGDRLDNVQSLQEERRGAPLPNVEATHQRLLDDPEALDYLLSTRGFTMEVVRQMKLGLDEYDAKKWLLFPYINKGTLVFAKWRTLPPAEKDFRAVSGRETPLYNEDALKPEMEELLLVEGESDTLSCLSNGISDVMGVPGANMKRAPLGLQAADTTYLHCSHAVLTM